MFLIKISVDLNTIWAFATISFADFVQILRPCHPRHIPSLGRQWGMHGELIRAGNNHITKQFQCCNLLLVSQYWFPDNIVSLWIALASKTISGAISPRLSDWHNSLFSCCWGVEEGLDMVVSDYRRHVTKALWLSWWALAHWHIGYADFEAS